MKKNVLLAVLLLSGALGAYAQTKGTNSLGLGVNFGKNEITNPNGTTNTDKNKSFSLRYALFVSDNSKIGVGASIMNGEDQSSKTKGFGTSFLYQKYYPIYKGLNVFWGGNVNYSKQKVNRMEFYIPKEVVFESKYYGAGAYGGVSYFLGKRLELEATIINTGFGYQSVNNNSTINSLSSKQSGFSLSTTGSFTNLGFNINFLF